MAVICQTRTAKRCLEYTCRWPPVVESSHTTHTRTPTRRIAYGIGKKDPRWARVVTSDGQLIAESGTMSGGGNRQMRGRMRIGSAAPGAGAGACRLLYDAAGSKCCSGVPRV